VMAGGEHPPGALPRVLIVIGASAIWGALFQAIAVVYYQARVRELGRLEDLKRALDEGAP